MKKTFFAGLATLLPIAVTLFVIIFVVDFLTTPFVGIVEDFISQHEAIELGERHKYLLVFISRLLVLVLFFLLIMVLGFLGRKIAFSWFINLTHKLFYKIPIVKTIYRITKEMSSTIFTEEKKTFFKGTVKVPFPHAKSHVLGLLSGSPPKSIDDQKKDLQVVFVPTAPHPVSGFLVMYDDVEVQKTDIETEDLFKFLLSCGIYHPGEEEKK